ncbi:MAG: cyanophycinase [Flavobacterium sp.]|nr:cyanophycinase [Flavobacterium sp.]
MKTIHFFTTAFLLLMLSCQSQNEAKKIQNSDLITKSNTSALGKLFIIGGGKKSDALISELIALSNLKKENFMVILPMASEEPDSAVYYTAKQFIALGINPNKIKSFNFDINNQKKTQLDSLSKASLIYITGGDQNLFMQSVLNTKAYDAIHIAYQQGATIAGTSAGAAVMSQKMITGNEFKHPKYTGDFRAIEAENFEIKTGLGLLSNAIIDQHFIRRMRMNRLLSVALENPNQMAIGIDESTAIVVEGNSARVTGNSQVVIIHNNDKKSIHVKNGLLGSKDIKLEILLPGENFKL